MSRVLPTDYATTEDEEADWSVLENSLQSRYKIALPAELLDSRAPDWQDVALEELREKFKRGDVLAAWRALQVACRPHRSEPIPPWIVEHFSDSLTEYVIDRSFRALVGSWQSSLQSY